MRQEPWLWTEDDLLELITLAVQENLELDYKRCDALQKIDSKKNEISKDVSAFANSAGGTIVYGVKEVGHLPQEIDTGLDPAEITREWLEQVINSRIQRRIDGVRVNQVLLTRTAPGRVAYVVHVPQSNHAPHQAWDKRFYKRFNFESVPMEEYEVRDVANRSTSPDLQVQFAFRPGDSEVALTQRADTYSQPIGLVAVVTNSSQTVANHAVFHLHIDDRILLEDVPSEVRRHEDKSTLKMDQEEVSLAKLTILWDDKKGLPLFAGVEAEIPAPALTIRIPCNEKLLALRYTVGAPRMPAKDHFVFIAVHDGRAQFILPTVASAPGNADAD